MQKTGSRLLGVVALLAMVLGLAIWQWRARSAPQLSVSSSPSPRQAALVRAAPSMTVSKAREPVREAEPAPTQSDTRVHGFVLGPDGTPVAGAVVESQPRGTRLATSGENGEFWFVVARNSVVVRGRQGELQSPPAIAHAGVADQDLLLTLKPAGTLLVQVTSATSRQPVAGAALLLTRNHEPIGSELRSDERGEARFVLTRGGHLLVRASANNFGAAARAFWASTSSAGEQRITLALPPECSAHGRVQSRDGKPAAAVTVVASDISSSQPPFSVQTDAEGRYRVAGLYPGVFRFEANDPVLGRAISAAVEVKRDTLVNLRLDDRPALAGVVFDEAARPTSTAQVVLWPQADGAYRAPEQRLQVSDASGYFRFVGLPTARAKLAATLGELSSAIVELDLARQKSVELRLQATQVISGRVVAAGGNPVPNASVLARRALTGESPRAMGSPDEAQASADERGQFQLRVLGTGKWNLFAHSPTDLLAASGGDAERVLATVEAGAIDVVLVVAGTGAIEGWVELEDGSLPEQATLVLAERPLASPSGGTFLFEGIPEGTHDVVVTGPEFEPTFVKGVTVRAGETTLLDAIKVKAGRRLRGRVTTASGAPVSGAEVAGGPTLYAAAQGLRRSQVEEEPELRTAYTDDSGRFELRGLARGTIGVMAEQAAYGRSSIVALDDDLPRELELQIQRTANVRGKVTRAGAALEGIAVVTKDAAGVATFTATSGQDGRYELVHLPAGKYVITAVNRQETGSYDMHRRELTLSAGQDAALDFELGEPGVRVTVQLADREQEPEHAVLKGPSVYIQETRTDGAYVFNDVVPGNYALCVTFKSSGGEAAAPRCQPVAVAAAPARQQMKL